jgi:pyrroline-5-carboxylate reductase
MATALSTGPAYIFMFMEALVDAASRLRAVCRSNSSPRRCAAHGVRRPVGQAPAELRNQASPGGTTPPLSTTWKRGVAYRFSRAICRLSAVGGVGAGEKVKGPSACERGRASDAAPACEGSE